MRVGRPRRPGRALLALLIVAILSAGGRALWANGVFSTANTGFSGACKIVAALPVTDMEVGLGTVFLAVSDPHGLNAADGIYALLPNARAPVKLAGTPKDFHPRGIGLSAADGKSLFLFAVNKRNTGKFSIDSFEVKDAMAAPSLAPQGTVEGGLLTNPQDVAAAGPGSFFVANGTASHFAPLHALQHYGVLPGGEVLYFNGMSFKSVADGFYGARSLVLTADGNHLIVGGLLSRSVTTFTREAFTGALTEADTKLVGASPEMLSRDATGQIWVAGHAKLFDWRAMANDPAHHASSQVFRLDIAGGLPQEPQQIYGNDGSEISGAGVAVAQGNRLLIGSAQGRQLLSCIQ